MYEELLGPGIAAMIAGMIGFFIVIGIAVYVYSALAMMAVAKRLKTEPAWLAWIPIANLYLMSKMAKKHWWPILLLIIFWIPIVGQIALVAFMVFQIIWLWKICEARGKEGWLAVLTIIPFVGGIWGLVLWGMLAWGKD